MRRRHGNAPRAAAVCSEVTKMKQEKEKVVAEKERKIWGKREGERGDMMSNESESCMGLNEVIDK